MLCSLQADTKSRGSSFCRKDPLKLQNEDPRLNALFECYVVSRIFECRGSLLWTAADQLFIYVFRFMMISCLFMSSEGATRCKSCHLDFFHREKVIPFDVIFSYKERWMYPIKGDWSNCKPSQRETVRYYRASKKCPTNRFPYFSLEYIHIPSDVKESLRDSHKKYLANEFGLTFD